MKLVQDQVALRLATIFGFLAIAIGAFGAHAIKFQEVKMDAWFATANKYQMFGVVLLLFLSFCKNRKALCFNTLGILIFSGGLYAMSMGAPRFLGAIVPIGGLCFLVAWMIVFISTFQKSE